MYLSVENVGADYIELKWNQAYNSDYYIVELKTSPDKEYEFKDRVSTNYCKIFDLEWEHEYSVRVSAYQEIDSEGHILGRGESNSISFKTLWPEPAQNSLSYPRNFKGESYDENTRHLELSWDPVADAAFYQIEMWVSPSNSSETRRFVILEGNTCSYRFEGSEDLKKVEFRLCALDSSLGKELPCLNWTKYLKFSY